MLINRFFSQSPPHSSSQSSPFKTELVSKNAKLYRLSPINEDLLPKLAKPYGDRELKETHLKIVQVADTISLNAIGDTHTVGFHGTSRLYVESILSGIKVPDPSEGPWQLGEGFYVAVGDQSKASSKLYADIMTFSMKRTQAKSLENDKLDTSYEKDHNPFESVVLEVKVKNFNDMKGLIVPKQFYRDSPMVSGQPKQVLWCNDDLKKVFIEDYDYLIAQFSSPILDNGFEIKFNPRSFNELIIEEMMI